MSSVKAFFKSFVYAFRGVKTSFQLGRNFKVQTAMALVTIALGFGLNISPGEWLIIVLCVAGVLSGECANTALEAAVDLATKDKNPIAARAKDCAAGAVIIWAIGSLVVAAIIFAPKLLALMA